MIKKAVLLSLMGCSSMFCFEELETAIRELDVERVEQILKDDENFRDDVYLVELVKNLNSQIRDYKVRCIKARELGLAYGLMAAYLGGIAVLIGRLESGRARLLLAGLIGCGPAAGMWLANKFCPKLSTVKLRSIMYFLLKRLSPEQRACAQTPGLVDEW